MTLHNIYIIHLQISRSYKQEITTAFALVEDIKNVLFRSISFCARL